jgi:hypothetical protein
MGTNMLFQVPRLAVQYCSHAEIYGTWSMGPFRASGIFRKYLAKALGLTERCEPAPYAGIAFSGHAN